MYYLYDKYASHSSHVYSCHDSLDDSCNTTIMHTHHMITVIIMIVTDGEQMCSHTDGPGAEKACKQNTGNGSIITYKLYIVSMISNKALRSLPSQAWHRSASDCIDRQEGRKGKEGRKEEGEACFKATLYEG